MNELSDDWWPTCSLELLCLRAQMLEKIRHFFAHRSVLEVETPLLGSAIGTDPQLDFFASQYQWPPAQKKLFLQTSPEFAMKRLLASGSGSIYQICKAFRNGESGRYHNPEFTLLEWYRVGYDLPQLMNEVAELMAILFEGTQASFDTERVRYQSLFQQFTGLNCLEFCYDDYAGFVNRTGLAEAIDICGQDHGLWLDFIFSHCIQTRLAKNTLWMVYEYPACLSSLARINAKNALVTDRVELFINGVELGNGYFELNDAKEQERRFDKEIDIRLDTCRPVVAKDKRLLAALAAGLPDCSGIAIGLDRVLMLLSNSQSIDEVLAFSISKA